MLQNSTPIDPLRRRAREGFTQTRLERSIVTYEVTASVTHEGFIAT